MAEPISARSTVEVPVLQLLTDMEGRIVGQVQDVRAAVAGLATKEDIQRVEKHLAGHDVEIEALKDRETGRQAVGDRQRRAWGVMVGAVGVAAAVCSGLGTLLYAFHWG